MVTQHIWVCVTWAANVVVGYKSLEFTPSSSRQTLSRGGDKQPDSGFMCFQTTGAAESWNKGPRAAANTPQSTALHTGQDVHRLTGTEV